MADLRRRFMDASKQGSPAPGTSGEGGESGAAQSADRTSVATSVPRGSGRLNTGGTVTGGSVRGGKDKGELFDVMSEGGPKGPESNLDPAGGERLTVKGDFENLNHRDLGVKGFAGQTEEADKALGAWGGLKSAGLTSSLREAKKVTLPTEGGPDSQRSGQGE